METFSLEKILKQFARFLWETLYNIGLILLVVIVVRSFIMSPFHVSGSSMFPTLHHNDYIIIDKLSYQFSKPEFGDIVVFTPPNPRMREVSGPQCFVAKLSSFNFSDDSCVLPDYFIKRVMGVPGDIIEVKDGEVYRNGELLSEEYLDDTNSHRTFVPQQDQYMKYEVPAGEYFVMGDNRNGSSDSRASAREWKNPETGMPDPFVQREDIEGKLFFTLVSPYNIQQFLADRIVMETGNASY